MQRKGYSQVYQCHYHQQQPELVPGQPAGQPSAFGVAATLKQTQVHLALRCKYHSPHHPHGGGGGEDEKKIVAMYYIPVSPASHAPLSDTVPPLDQLLLLTARRSSPHPYHRWAGPYQLSWPYAVVYPGDWTCRLSVRDRFTDAVRGRHVTPTPSSTVARLTYSGVNYCS